MTKLSDESGLIHFTYICSDRMQKPAIGDIAVEPTYSLGEAHVYCNTINKGFAIPCPASRHKSDTYSVHPITAFKMNKIVKGLTMTQL